MSDTDEGGKGAPQVIDGIVKKESEIDYASGFRAFANKNNVRVLRYLQKNGSMSLKELRDETGLSNNELNHRLQALKALDFVIIKEHKYCLTKYGTIMTSALIEIQKNLLKEPEPLRAVDEISLQGKTAINAVLNTSLIADAWTLYRKAEHLENLNQSQDAIRAFKLASELFLKLNLVQEALEAYDRVIKIDPQSSDAWYHKGEIFRKLGMNEESIRAYDKALEINPNHRAAFFAKHS